MDKIKELENKINELASEIERLKEEQENKPTYGEDYWFVRYDNEVVSNIWYDDFIDEARYTIGNVFRTKEEAEFRAEQLKVEAELRRFSRPFDENKNNFQLIYSHLSHKVAIDSCTYILLTNMHFPSEEIAQKAIETVDEERIKKYYFGVNG